MIDKKVIDLFGLDSDSIWEKKVLSCIYIEKCYQKDKSVSSCKSDAEFTGYGYVLLFDDGTFTPIPSTIGNCGDEFYNNVINLCKSENIKYRHESIYN